LSISATYSSPAPGVLTCDVELGDPQASEVCYVTLSASMSGGSGNYSFYWYVHNNSQTIPSENPLVVCVFGGPYVWPISVTLYVRDNTQGCITSISDYFNSFCDPPAPLKRQNEDKIDTIDEFNSDLSDNLKLDYNSNMIKNIVIYDLNGMIVKNIDYKMLLDDIKYIENNPIINSLNEGFYIFNFIRYDGTAFAKKFIKN